MYIRERERLQRRRKERGEEGRERLRKGGGREMKKKLQERRGRKERSDSYRGGREVKRGVRQRLQDTKSQTICKRYAVDTLILFTYDKSKFVNVCDNPNQCKLVFKS